ncbi:MAG: hypothetical protein AABX32_01130 [Nanoarchaeota archaeon]
MAQIDLSVASESVRPMLEELVGCFAFIQGEDVGHELYPEMENPSITILVDDKIEGLLQRIVAVNDGSAAPVLLKMLGKDSQLIGMNYQALYNDFFDAHIGGCCPSQHTMFIDRFQSSPDTFTIYEKVLYALRMIVDGSPNRAELFRAYPNLGDYVKAQPSPPPQ